MHTHPCAPMRTDTHTHTRTHTYAQRTHSHTKRECGRVALREAVPKIIILFKRYWVVHAGLSLLKMGSYSW